MAHLTARRIAISVAVVMIAIVGYQLLPSGGNSTADLPVRHTLLAFSQQLELFCDGLEVVDNRGFDQFTMEIWIDSRQELTRFDVRYPDGSEYAMVLEGPGPEWRAAWVRGVDAGRVAGCLERRADGSSSQSVVGWAAFEQSALFFEHFLMPAVFVDGQLVTPAFSAIVGTDPDGDGTYEGEVTTRDGRGVRRIESELDSSGHWLARQHHSFAYDGQHSEVGVWNVRRAESRTTVPPDTFDLEGFDVLWADG